MTAREVRIGLLMSLGTVAAWMIGYGLGMIF